MCGVDGETPRVLTVNEDYLQVFFIRYAYSFILYIKLLIKVTVQASAHVECNP